MGPMVQMRFLFRLLFSSSCASCHYELIVFVFKIYLVCFDPLQLLFCLMLKLSLIQPVRAPASLLWCLLDMTLVVFVSFLVSSLKRCPRPIINVSCSRPGFGHFSKEPRTFPVRMYVDNKMKVLGVHIDTGRRCFQLFSMNRTRKMFFETNKEVLGSYQYF